MALSAAWLIALDQIKSILRLRVSLAGFLTCAVLAYAGHLFALPGRDIQAGFRFTVLGFPGVERQSAFDINAITLFRARRYFLGNLTEAGDAKPLAHVFSVIGLADSDDDACIFSRYSRRIGQLMRPQGARAQR